MLFMRFNKKIIIFISFFSIVFIGSACVARAAGTLTPPSGSPTSQSYTLSDIYARLISNATAIVGNHSLSTTTSPAVSFYSLSDIYSAIPTITNTQVATGTSYLGISGILLGNIFNGTCDNPDDFGVSCRYFSRSYTGGSQTNGGVDDFNGYKLGGVPPADRYSTTWTTCGSGNNYCGTGDTGAAAKDNATGIVWSYPCSGSDCSSWDTVTDYATLTSGCLPSGNCAYATTDTLYSWNENGANNNGHTAGQLCSQHTGWSLPNQKQLMQAYIDGSYGNLEPQGVYRYYWAATAVSFGTAQFQPWAWLINLSNGYSYDNRMDKNHSIRCVR
jgi:hypothetical protein